MKNLYYFTKTHEMWQKCLVKVTKVPYEGYKNALWRLRKCRLQKCPTSLQKCPARFQKYLKVTKVLIHISLCAKYGNFITFCTLFNISLLTMWNNFWFILKWRLVSCFVPCQILKHVSKCFTNSICLCSYKVTKLPYTLPMF